MKVERLIPSTMLMLLFFATASNATNTPDRLFAQFESPPKTIPLAKIELVKQQYEQCLLGINGVTGVGIGKDATDKDVIVVYLLNTSVQKYTPKKLDGFAVQTRVTGVIRPQANLQTSPQITSSTASTIELVKQQYEQCLLGINGVTGVGIGKDATDKDVIVVYLLNASVQKYIPKKLDSFAVHTRATGVIRPLER